jgi:hypothetical protein
MILHVPLLSYNDTHSVLPQLLKTHMTVRVLQFIVSNDKVVTVLVPMFLHPISLQPLLTG